MGDRKVTNHYIPPDFDPSKIPKGKKLSSKDGTTPVRMMLPFSMQCLVCGEFLYQGRKFNSKKETMNQKYLGTIARYRFYIKCSKCANYISFCTDPQNNDYLMEKGATRNFEMKREKQEQIQQEQQDNKQKDHMEALESRVLESQREQADLQNLQDIQRLNAQHKNSNVEEYFQKRDLKQQQEDEKIIQSIPFQSKKEIRKIGPTPSVVPTKRPSSNTTTATNATKLPIVLKKRKIITEKGIVEEETKDNTTPMNQLLCGYGSSSEDE